MKKYSQRKSVLQLNVFGFPWLEDQLMNQKSSTFYLLKEKKVN